MAHHAEAPPVVCQVCHQSIRARDAFPTDFLRPAMLELIRKDHPEFGPGNYICHTDLNRYRAAYVEDALEAEKGELSQLEQDVIDSLNKQDLIAENLNAEFDRELTIGERMADRLADFGGSWGFIACFALAMAAWIAINSARSLGWSAQPFDPFPFILLNLVLSCLAAIQAPVIMMSQNRQEAKDRLRSEHDYRVNLKAELEIRHLHAKLDMLLTHQWQRLLEIQQIQTDLIEELAQRRGGR
jgi:uncharacterized membrane protein